MLRKWQCLTLYCTQCRHCGSVWRSTVHYADTVAVSDAVLYTVQTLWQCLTLCCTLCRHCGSVSRCTVHCSDIVSVSDALLYPVQTLCQCLTLYCTLFRQCVSVWRSAVHYADIVAVSDALLYTMQTLGRVAWLTQWTVRYVAEMAVSDSLLHARWIGRSQTDWQYGVLRKWQCLTLYCTLCRHCGSVWRSTVHCADARQRRGGVT